MNRRRVFILALAAILIATLAIPTASANTYTTGNVYQGLRLITGQNASARASGTQDKYVTVNLTNYYWYMNPLLGTYQRMSQYGSGSGMGAADAYATAPVDNGPAGGRASANIGGSYLAVSGAF